MKSEYFTRKEAADYLNVSVALLDKLARTGKGPMFYKLGTYLTRYHLDDLNAWLATKIQTAREPENK